MNVKYSCESNIGKKRVINQDSYLVDQDTNLFIVADGMGGHKAGEIASQVALDVFRENFLKGINQKDPASKWMQTVDPSQDEISNVIKASIKIANSHVFQMSLSNSEYKGMGTTIAGIYLFDDTSYIFNIGDSRVYSYKSGNLLQITEDHSWIQEQIKLDLLTNTQAQKHQWKNVITRALGTTRNINNDLFKHTYESGEVFLICSDGLNSMVKDEKIKASIETYRLDIYEIPSDLIKKANEAGGEDNITIIALEII